MPGFDPLRVDSGVFSEHSFAYVFQIRKKSLKMSGFDSLKAGSGVFSGHDFCAQELKACTFFSFAGPQRLAEHLEILTTTLPAVAFWSLSMGSLPHAFLAHRPFHFLILPRVLQLLSPVKA